MFSNMCVSNTSIPMLQALAEEKTVYDRSINKLKYLSIAVNALKRLKNQNILPAKGMFVIFMHMLLFKLLQPLLFTALYNTPIRSISLYVLTAPSERDQHVSRGNVPLNTQALQGPGKSWLSFQGQTRVLTCVAIIQFFFGSLLKCTVGCILFSYCAVYMQQ